ncbi:MAG: hypothetical protein ACRDO4_06255 [Nocardioides sp.]
MAKGKKANKLASKKARKRAEQASCAACGNLVKLPKKKCCESKSRCNRCPLRMLKEGTLPQGYTVHKRKLVTVEKAARVKAEKQAKKAGKAA